MGWDNNDVVDIYRDFLLGGRPRFRVAEERAKRASDTLLVERLYRDLGKTFSSTRIRYALEQIRQMLSEGNTPDEIRMIYRTDRGHQKARLIDAILDIATTE